MSKLTVDPRVAPKEMIVTRFKSAQQKRALRDKDKSMKNVTDLLKSPTSRKSKEVKKKTVKSTQKANVEKPKEVVKSPPKCSEVTEILDVEYTEYYPDKLRRKFEEKRIFLRPKYELKTVVKMNKRKLVTPKRGTDFLPKHSYNNTYEEYRSDSPKLSDLSMEEVVRIVEETESLDDEDLMEILTCPSPVWWEDPPDEDYIEEPIFRTQDKKEIKPNKVVEKQIKKISSSVKETDEIESNIINSNITDIKLNNKDDKFIKKRGKLENLLDNIKNKTVTHNTDDKCQTDVTTAIDKDIVNKITDLNSSENSKSFSDLCLLNDELLNDFENINIPIEVSGDNLLKKNINYDKIKDKIKELYTDKDTENKDGTQKVETVIAVEKLNEVETQKVPLNLPPLTKCSKLDNLKLTLNTKSMSGETDMSLSSGQENVDSISDTNIKFISGEECDIVMDNGKKVLETNKELDSEKTEDQTDILKAIREKKDFITVYKIVSSVKEATSVNKFKNIPEYSSHVENLMKQDTADDPSKHDGQLNSFFKKCKNINRKRKRDDAIFNSSDDSQLCEGCVPKKSITVAQNENVKYCLNCSSIFDTEECSYCINKNEVNDEVISVNDVP